MNYSERKARFLRKLKIQLKWRVQIVIFAFVFTLVVLSTFFVTLFLFNNAYSLLGLVILPFFWFALSQNFLHLKRLEMDLPAVLIAPFRNLVDETKFRGFYSKEKLKLFEKKLEEYDLSQEEPKKRIEW